MISKLFNALVLIAALTCAGPAIAQTVANNNADISGAGTTKALRTAAPFLIGETLVYEGKISKFLPGIAVADLTFEVKDAPDGENYLVNVEARSKGTLLKLFRYSFLQRVASTFGGRDLRAIQTLKHDVQKDRVRDSQAVFDYGERRVTFVETDPNEPMRPPRKIASEIDDSAQDMISSLYNMRLMPLEVGKTFSMSVSDSGLVYLIPVKVTAKERQKTVFGKVMCFRVEPEIFGPGRLIENDGSMVIWVTDDARRIPVRALVDASVGKIEIKLRSAKNLKGAPDKTPKRK
ncbi:MAG: DUF3108 domain-containing protein [Acidobacteriota bacterium]